MNSGCICCSLVGDFSKALTQVVNDYNPDRILIEPSGVGKLSDVTKAVIDADIKNTVVNSAVVVVDVNKCKMYMKNFGEFFNDQIEHAGCIYFSHTDKNTDAKLNEAVELVRQHNKEAELIVTPVDKLDIKTIIDAFEKKSSIENQMSEIIKEASCHHEHHHHHDEHCDCHEHHHHDEHCDCHEHHHHDEHCDCHEHHHHDEHCDCHEHNHHHHDEHCGCHEHHHHAEEVFTSWGRETLKKYSADDISNILVQLQNRDKYGFILRAKGIVENVDGTWIHFDYVPGEADVRCGGASTIGKLCVIGSKIDEDAISKLFEL